MRHTHLLCAGVLAITVANSAYAQGFFTAGNPVYSAAQSLRGKPVYEKNCASCHGPNMDDGQFGVALKGVPFKRHFTASNVDALFTYIAAKMPPSGRGSLTDENFADVTAHILQANNEPAGPKDFVPTLAGVAKPAAELISHNANQDEYYKKAVAARSALIGKLSQVTDAMLQNPGDSDWLLWRRTYDNISHSPLNQITKANVANLNAAWSLALSISINEITPLVHDGVLFVQSGMSVQALNAPTGELLWQYVRKAPPQGYNVRDARMKSIGIYGSRIYALTADGHVIALEAKTGALIWDREIIAPQHSGVGASGFRANSGPLIVKGKIILGVSGGSSVGGGAYIVALDAVTGKEAWRFSTIAKPGVKGGDSWNGAPPGERFGAGVWTIGSYDAKENLVYFGTGNTYDAATLLTDRGRKGESADALYTDSTLALNPDTGKLKWYYQHMNRDVWDMDWTFERSLITLERDGKSHKALVTAGKIAVFDVLERDTGKYIFSRDIGLQNIVKSIDPVTGRKIINPAVEPQADKAKFVCPNANGARNWLTTAYDPATSIIYMPMIESCADYTFVSRPEAEVKAGGSDIRFAQKPPLGHDGNFGRLEAVDLKTGKTVWRNRQRAAFASSLVATAGGVLFGGSFDRTFKAYDLATGDTLWETALNAPPNASPITYAVNGEQYVAVVAGTGGPIESGSSSLTPELYNPPGGITLWVFKLRSSLPHHGRPPAR